MSKKKTIALFSVVVVAMLAFTPMLFACNDDAPSIAGKGVSRPENTFVNDLDSVNGENLAADAAVAVSSGGGAENLTDGDKETAWTADGTDDEYIDITFSATTEINTVVLRENGNYITGFRFLKPDGNGGWEEFYRQDRMERYRYCTFDAVSTNAIRISIDGANEGRDVSVAEVEVYDLAPKTYSSEFRVFSYFTPGDYRNARDNEAARENLSMQFDVVTDLIFINFADWSQEGEVIEVAGDDADESTSLLAEALDFVRDLAGDRTVNACVDFWPVKDSNGTALHGLPEHTDTLVSNLAAFADKYDLAGLDFDWEYPPTPDEWFCYGELLRLLKERVGDSVYVSVALSSFNVRFTDEQIDAIDFVQIMGYDRFDPDGNNASFRSGAYLPMRYFVNLGFEPSQLIAGMPVYGRPDNETVAFPINGLGIWTDYCHNGGQVTSSPSEYDDNNVLIKEGSAYTYWDNVQYLQYTENNVTYNNMKVYVTGGAMAADKTAYAIEQGFAGVMLFRNLEDFPMDDPGADGDGMSRSIVKAIGETIAERIAR